MLYDRQALLIERYRALGWTSKEVGRLWGCSPGTASSKLNGFIVLKDRELRLLEESLLKEEQSRAMKINNQKGVSV